MGINKLEIELPKYSIYQEIGENEAGVIIEKMKSLLQYQESLASLFGKKSGAGIATSKQTLQSGTFSILGSNNLLRVQGKDPFKLQNSSGKGLLLEVSKREVTRVDYPLPYLAEYTVLTHNSVSFVSTSIQGGLEAFTFGDIKDPSPKETYLNIESALREIASKHCQ